MLFSLHSNQSTCQQIFKQRKKLLSVQYWIVLLFGTILSMKNYRTRFFFFNRTKVALCILILRSKWANNICSRNIMFSSINMNLMSSLLATHVPPLSVTPQDFILSHPNRNSAILPHRIPKTHFYTMSGNGMCFVTRLLTLVWYNILQ